MSNNEYMPGDIILHNGLVWTCSLCHRTNFDKTQVEHREDCPFSDPDCIGIRVEKIPNDRWLIETLLELERSKAPYEKRLAAFRAVPMKYKVEVCLGCGKEDDCGCPAGTGEQLRENWRDLL